MNPRGTPPSTSAPRPGARAAAQPFAARSASRPRAACHSRGGIAAAHASGAPGQALVITALALVALLGVVGLVLNLGLFLVERRHLQNAADAAALAGTWTLLDQQTARTFDSADAAIAARVQQVVLQNGVALGTDHQLQATYVDQTGTQLGSNVGGGSFPTTAAGVHVTLSGSFSTLLAAFVGQAGIPARADAEARLAPVAFPTNSSRVIPATAPLSAFQSGAQYDLYSLSTAILDLSSIANGRAAPTYGPDPHWNVQLWSDGSHDSGTLQVGSTVAVAGPAFATDVQTGLNDNWTRQGRGRPWLLVTVPLCDPCGSERVTVVGFAQFNLAGSDIGTRRLPGFFVPYAYDPSGSARQTPGPAWPLWSPSVVALTG